MQPEDFISAEAFCEYYKVEISFINSLNDYGLIEINTIEEKRFISNDKLGELEKFINLYYDLDINVAGIDAITHLLHRIKDLQNEVALLKSKLQIHE
jgi:MerR HTH family regulatory protein